MLSKHVKQGSTKIATTIILAVASAGTMSEALARPEWAMQFNLFPVCTACHTESIGLKTNVKKAAWDAYYAPAPNGGVIPGLQNFLKGSANAKPVLLPIDTQWSVQVGEVPLAIPLIVKDKEADSFTMKLAKSTPVLNGYSFSKPYTLTGVNLPAVDFKFKPTALQKNKNYSVVFQATETTGGKQASNTVAANVFVWAARPALATNVVNQFSVVSAKWAAGKMTLTGNIVFKPKATAAAKTAALAKLKLNIKSNNGIVVGTPVLLKPSAKGVWTSTFALTATQVPCLVKAEYEKLMAARTVKGAPVASCIK